MSVSARLEAPVSTLAEALCRASHDIDSDAWFPCPEHRTQASVARTWLTEWADTDLVDVAISDVVTKARVRGFADDEQANAVVRAFLATLTAVARRDR